jgi:DNA-binding NarL/FixJ family response regulator
MKVLVVEDSRTVRERIVKLVSGVTGIEAVAEAGDVAGALDAFERVPPDLVVLDLNLPGRSGMDLLPILKTRIAPLTVVVLTNQTGRGYARRCRELGADYFFDKSKQFQLAIEVVRDMLAREEGAASTVGENPTPGAAGRPTPQSGSRR